MLGTSDTWSMSRSSHRPSNPAYFIEDCRISRLPPAALTVVNCSKGHVMLETTRLAFLITALQGQKYQGLFSIPRYEQVINKHVFKLR